MTIIPIHPLDALQDTGPDAPQDSVADSPVAATDPVAGRRTLGRNSPSRRTLGRMQPSRRTLGRNQPSRRTLGRAQPSRRTLGRTQPSRRTLGRGHA